MLIKDLQKTVAIPVVREVTAFTNLTITNALLKEYLKINYQVESKYHKETDEIFLCGKINFAVLVMDARDGNEITHQELVEWDERYFLSDFSGEEVDFDELAAEQINANIPINFSHNYGTINKVGPGWQLMSEEEYEMSKQQTRDLRWEKLREFSKQNK